MQKRPLRDAAHFNLNANCVVVFFLCFYFMLRSMDSSVNVFVHRHFDFAIHYFIKHKHRQSGYVIITILTFFQCTGLGFKDTSLQGNQNFL